MKRCDDTEIASAEVAAFRGLNDSYVWMEVRLMKLAPKCHFTPMSLESGDGEDCINQWWECQHCGHKKIAR